MGQLPAPEGSLRYVAPNSTGGLDELSHTLRQLREAAGVSGGKMRLEDAAAASGFSVSKINRIERGKTLPTPDDAVKLAETYGANRATRTLVRDLADTVKASSRRVVLSRANREGFQQRLRKAAEQSHQIREFSPVIIPGLVQTSEYMWALWATGGGSREAGEKFVAERLGAQAVLENPNKHVTILTTEGALGWAAGTVALMVRQLEHIAVISAKPRVWVGIVPFGTLADVFPVSNWMLYDERAAVPGILRTQLMLNAPEVDPYVEQYHQLLPLAVFDDDARAILARVADRYRGLT